MKIPFRLEHPFLCVAFLIGIIITWLIVRFFKRTVILKYSFVSQLIKKLGDHSVMGKVLTEKLLRYGSLLLLLIAVGMPQLVDHYSKISVEGIDIIIALDASGSMVCFDDIHDRRDRFTVAKKEAIRFAQNRPDDQIGLVLFGKEAVSRCPLTLDKKVITEIIEKTELGVVNSDGTVLSIGLMMALKRLQSSKAKSKVVILLTDGEPTPEYDAPPEKAIGLAKKLGIKVYTIGIGNQRECYIEHPLFGLQAIRSEVNKTLLKQIATETGGQFFMAEDPVQMRTIYDTINALEKTSTQTPLYARYTDIGHYFIWAALCVIIVRLLLFNVVWKLIS